MEKNFISVFDSGIGGLTVLEKLIEIFPNENFYYVADQGHCPYGPKPQSYVGDRVEKICKHMENLGAKAVVIACNTASLQIERGRQVCNIPIISVIQPTAAKAISLTKNHKIAVLATKATIESGTYQKLIQEKGNVAFGLACGEFVDFVENNELDNPLGQEIVDTKLAEIKDKGFDTLIHGCTHFSLLEDKMRKVLGDINYVACGLPTGEALKEILNSKNLLLKENKDRIVEIYTTGSVEKALMNMKWFKKEHRPVEHIDIE